jgi:Endosomal/lysosomal potassium channel TMEM175
MRAAPDRVFTASRVEAFSDGVLAIVITLLVLEIKTPRLHSTENVGQAWLALVDLVPKFASFFLSFFFIAVFWVNHHRLFALIRKVDWGILWLNNLLLLLLCFVPFPTAFIGDGRRMTGFANSEEDFADQAVGRKLMPFRIEDEARKLGAQFSTAPAFQPYAVRDGNLITGQQQHSGAEVARLVIETLEESRS